MNDTYLISMQKIEAHAKHLNWKWIPDRSGELPFFTNNWKLIWVSRMDTELMQIKFSIIFS